MNKEYYLADSRFKEIEPFTSKIWLASPTMHGDEQKWVDEAIRTNWVSTVGANINEVERMVAEKIGVKYAVGLSCGTAALHLAVKLCGEALYGQPKAGHGTLEGKKVIVPAYTYTATASAVIHVGARVVFVDSQEDSFEMDYDKCHWLKIEKLLPKDQLSTFFMDYLNTKIDGFVKEGDAYDVFKSVYKNGGFSNESMLEEVLHYAELYSTFLYGNDDKYGKEVNRLLRDLQKLKQTTVFLFLFPVFDDYENNVIDEKELERVLRFLLNYSIRRLICEVGSNSLRGLYKTLYARVFARPENKQHYYDAIVSFFQQLTSRDALPDDKTFIQALKQNNLYRKNALCKFLLAAIENQGKEQLIMDNLTIEHIMPQNKNLSTAWQKMLGEEVWQSVQEKYLHTLGNLTLTAYNSELGDKPFDVKQQELDEVKTKVVILYSDVKGLTVWNADTIEKRADRLSDAIVKLYPIEQPEQVISFADPRYQEYTCEDPDTATYKAPNYYILQGERVNITNFAEMLRSVISRLYEQDSSIIEDMARKNEKILSWSQNVMFSYDVDQVYGDYKLENTDIYESTGFSAAHIMYIIRALLDRYDIDRSDFVYSARSNKSTGKEDK